MNRNILCMTLLLMASGAAQAAIKDPEASTVLITVYDQGGTGKKKVVPVFDALHIHFAPVITNFPLYLREHLNQLEEALSGLDEIATINPAYQEAIVGLLAQNDWGDLFSKVGRNGRLKFIESHFERAELGDGSLK